MVAGPLTKPENAIKALQEIATLVSFWRQGKATHESIMVQIDEIVRRYSK